MSILNNKTLKVLQSLSSINNSVIMSYPTVCVKDGKAVQAYFDVSQLGEDDFQEFGIYGITDFLSAVSLVTDPSIQLDGTVLKISNKNTKVSYNTANVGLLEEQCRGDFELLTRIKSNEKIGSFELSNETFKALRIASNTLKDLPNLIISSVENGILLKISANEKTSNSYSTTIDAETTEEFDIIVTLAMLKKIPNGDFKVDVYKSKKGSKVLVFTSKNIESLEIILSVKE